MVFSDPENQKDSIPVSERDAPSLAERVSQVVSRLEVPVADLFRDLGELEESFGQAVYSELLYLLAHLRMEPKEAHSHWTRILEVRQNLEELLETPVDVRVALVHYFVNINRKLSNPKVIELRLFQETQASAFRDELTGLYNYRYFREHLPREISLSDRHNTSLSLAMIDIDDFKLFNDRYGHSSGNDALVTLSDLIGEVIRNTDIAVRYGGEEFVVIFPATPKGEALVVSERLRKRIEAHSFADNDLTISLGVATYPGDSMEAKDLIRKADSAMYLAKSRGKNLACLFGDERRSFRRINAELGGSYCNLEAEFYSFRTLDLSENGILLLADRNLQIGTLIRIKMNLDDSDDAVTCSGRIIRVEEKETGSYQAAIRIVDISQQNRYRFYNYLRNNHSTEY